MTDPDGLLLVDKPKGITSHDAIDLIRRALGTRKVGHAGTLDPMATGLLLIGVGRATRLLRFLGDLPKTYDGVARLGVETTTLDAEGEVTQERPIEGIDRDAVSAAMTALTGESMQTPPAFSAVKVGGRTSYRAARRGEALEIDPRPIHVQRFELRSFDGRDASFTVTCSGGTYVRVLVAEIGTALGCGAHLAALRRTGIGPFSAEGAAAPDSPGSPLPVERIVAHLPRLDLDAEEAIAAGHGRILAPAGLTGPYGVFDPEGRLVGVYEDAETKSRPLVILAR